MSVFYCYLCDALNEKNTMQSSEKPFVSIIMPVYNASRFLARSVGSVIGQSCGDFELLCFNDASTDDSLDVLRRMAAADSRIRVIDSAVNIKQGGGRNRCLREARAEFVMFLDADDWLRPDAVELCRRCVRETGADAVFYDYVNVEQSTGRQSPYSQLGEDAESLDTEGLRRRIALCQSSICTTMYARRLFEPLGLMFPEGVFYEDNAIAMAVQLSAEHPVKINESLYFYRVDNTSVTRSTDNYHFFDRIDSAVTLLGHLKRLGIYERYRDEIDNVFIHQYFIHTVAGCIYRFTKLPYDRVKEVREGISEYVPGYRSNRYYRALPLSRRLRIELNARFPRLIHSLAGIMKKR